MKPVVLARKHRVNDGNFRDLRKYNDCAEHHERQSDVDPASLLKSRSSDTAQAGDPVDITQREGDECAAQ